MNFVFTRFWYQTLTPLCEIVIRSHCVPFCKECILLYISVACFAIHIHVKYNLDPRISCLFDMIDISDLSVEERRSPGDEVAANIPNLSKFIVFFIPIVTKE